MACDAERERVLASVTETDDDGTSYSRYPNQYCNEVGCRVALDSRNANKKSLAARLCNHHHWAKIEAKDKLRKLREKDVTDDLAARKLARAEIRAIRLLGPDATKAAKEVEAAKLAKLVAIADPRGPIP